MVDKLPPKKVSRLSCNRHLPLNFALVNVITGDSSTIQGWMVPIHAWLVGLFTRYQHNQGIWGAVGEIGVFQGKLFIALSGFSHPSETLVAADW